jgi:ribosome-binding factor A
MPTDLKKNKMAEYISHGVELYLSENVQYYQFAYVLSTNISVDFSNAYVYINCPESLKEENVEARLTKDKRKIAEKCKMIFNSKRTPHLIFKVVKSDELDF